ncbi:MAG: ABC transporter permease, partial [Bacteroidia bacterium]|nr:ABC transporter permease [Bacteroidia bacterium]
IKPITEQKEKSDKKEKKTGSNETKKFSPGLTLADLDALTEIIPGIEKAGPEIVIETNFIYGGSTKKGKLVGTTPDYFSITNFKLLTGSIFSAKNLSSGDQVCIIGKGIESRFFSQENPIGKYIKCGGSWLKIAGVLEEKKISENAISNLGIRDYNMDIYIPLKTMLTRYVNRAKVNRAKLQAQNNDNQVSVDDGFSTQIKNYNQLDRIIVKIASGEKVPNSVEVLARLLKRRHNGNADFEITVPEQLLKQQQRTKDIFNIVLGFIAGISLLVGGIGIMNIMLASVLERIKEIGIRLSMGATPSDIVQQFLFEAILISISGGIIGVIIGVSLSLLIPQFFDIQTQVTVWSIFISFTVAALTGLVFGINPARNAAKLDPIQSLRHE